MRTSSSASGPVSRSRRKMLPWVSLTVLLGAMLVESGMSQTAGGGANVLRDTLKNGLRVVIVRNHLAPVVTTVMNYRVGSNEAPEGFPGTAHALEHMMFRGSPDLSADQLADISASMGGRFDADTQQMVTQYFFTVPAEDLGVALHIEAIRMRGVLDSEKLWSQERGAIEQEVAQDLSNPEYVFYTKLLAAMFKGTPYARDALGTRPSFDQTTGAMLKKFHDTWYVPNNAVLVVVGDVQPRQALAEIKELFGGIPARNVPARQAFRPRPVAAETLHLTTDHPYGTSLVCFRMPGSGSPDFAAVEVLADVLGSQRGDLYALVPAGKALFADFSLNDLPPASLGYAMAAFPKDGDGAALVQEVRSVLAGYLKNGFPSDLVEAAKRQEMTAAALRKNSVSGLAMEWSKAVAVEGRTSPDDGVKAIGRVTAADVNRVARKYLDLNHAVLAILTPQPSGQPVSTSSFRGRESFTPQETRNVTLPSWAEKALKRVAVPASTLHPVVTTLPNGIKLIVQSESVGNTVSVYGHIKNNPDLETPKGQEGVAQLLEQLFSYGTTTHDRISFQKALDDIGASESAGPDFSLEVLTGHFERGVQLLAENEMHPALPEQDFRTVQRQLAAAVRGRLESPDYIAGRAIRRSLFPRNDPTLREATPATISARTLQDVKSYFQRVYRPDLATIVVIGEITPEKAREVVQKYFGEWKASGPKPPTVLPPVPANQPASVAVPNASRVQNKVTLAQTLGLNRSNPDYYALELGNHVLGGGFYATRLYRDLRENAGLVYFVSSSFQVGKSRALYVVEYACDPAHVSQARAIVERDLKEMQEAPVTPGELQQARAMLLREIPLSESSVSGIAAGMIARTVAGLPLDEPTRAAQRYVKLSAGEVQAAYRKWIRPGDFVQVTEGPNPH